MYSSKKKVNRKNLSRKTSNIGAVYELPTELDKIQWKAWPVHGMHERPVWNPEVGLATEYLGKQFVTINDAYHEIINHKSPECNINSKKQVQSKIDTPNCVSKEKINCTKQGGIEKKKQENRKSKSLKKNSLLIQQTGNSQNPKLKNTNLDISTTDLQRPNSEMILKKENATIIESI